MSASDGNQPVGPLGAIHTDAIPLGASVKVSKDKYTLLKFVDESIVKTYISTRVLAAVDNITVKCGGTVHCAIIPDSWGKPTDNADPNPGIGQCPAPAMTTLYEPTVRPTMIPFITSQIKPKTLIGEPPALLLWSSTDVTVNVTFQLHLHGVAPVKWS